MTEMTQTNEGARVVRRRPVQERSRRTVAAILDAAEALIDERGVNAATTRAIAERAGVTYPSLYRFFSDREQILDELLERHTTTVDELEIAAEPTWDIATPGDLMNAEFDLHVDYYRAHPSAARLWLGGRVSETVVEFVHRRIQTLADRIHTLLVERGVIAADSDPRAVLLAVELADRAMELAHRDRDDFDEELLAMGRAAVHELSMSLAR